MKTINLLAIDAFVLQTEIRDFTKLASDRPNGNLRPFAVFQTLKERGKVNGRADRSPGRLDKGIAQLTITRRD